MFGTIRMSVMISGSKKRNAMHPGVSVVKDARSGKRDTLKWKCPETGVRRTQRFKGATKPELIEHAKIRSSELQTLRKRMDIQSFVPVADVDQVKDWVSSNDVAARTRKNRETVLPYVRRLEDEVIGGPITQCRYEHLKVLREWVGAGPHKATTKTQYLLNIRSLFTDLIKNRRFKHQLDSEVVRHELRNFPTPTKDDQTRSSTPLNVEELRRGFGLLREISRPEVSAYMALLFLTGMRSAELADTNNWKLVDDQANEAHLTVFSSKNAKTRDVMLARCPMTIEIIKGLQQRASQDGVLFPHAGQSFSKSVGDIERKYLRKTLGFRFNPHRLRASCGTYLMLIGEQDSLICLRMDHSQLTALRHYRGGAQKIRPAISQPETLEAAAGLVDVFKAIVDDLASPSPS